MESIPFIVHFFIIATKITGLADLDFDLNLFWFQSLEDYTLTTLLVAWWNHLATRAARPAWAPIGAHTFIVVIIITEGALTD
jgi:hypothetical protein